MIFPIDWHNSVGVVPVLHVGGAVVSLRVKRGFGRVCAGRAGRDGQRKGSILFTAFNLVSKATYVYSVRAGGGLFLSGKKWPGFLPSVWLA